MILRICLFLSYSLDEFTWIRLLCMWFNLLCSLNETDNDNRMMINGVYMMKIKPKNGVRRNSTKHFCRFKWRIQTKAHQIIKSAFVQNENICLQEKWRKNIKKMIFKWIDCVGMFCVYVYCCRFSTVWKWLVLIYDTWAEETCRVFFLWWDETNFLG